MISVIDIGTNTILMVTGMLDSDGGVRIAGDEHSIARLGRGVDAQRMIATETFDRVAQLLVRYRSIAKSLGSRRIVAFGTSALRDAANAAVFIEEMRRRVRLDIEVLSGDDEARLTYSGALFGLQPACERSAVLDIGGGSTELALGDGSDVRRSCSLDIGAVRVSERYLATLPAARASVDEAARWCDDGLAGLFDVPAGTKLVGVAGTVTTLGAIDAGLERFDADELNGHRLSLAAVEATIDRLTTLTVGEIAAIPQITEGRADIILGGSLILRATMMRLAIAEVIVSTRGVRYGVLLRELMKRREDVPD